ncbi:hypothetical protein GCM10009846_02540 [Agrococcus versicolor]|uniref:Uncharacterized protein n=1 Tax=Agrococcus versicolor TaxID=501482 RepID=A0ABP5MD95_9MICO
MRRTAAWKPIAGVAAATIAIAGFGVAPATAAPEDPEQALARVLASNLLDAGLLDGATSYTGTSETPNPEANPLTLDSALLGASVGVAGGLQLPLIDSGTNNGLLALGQAGTLSSYAATTAGSSVAASGVLGADGAIAVDPDQAPGTPPAATVDLTQVLDQLGVAGITDAIVSELRLEAGAFAARAQTDGTTVTDEYALASLVLEFDSPAVAGLSTALDADLATITTDLNTAAAGLGGAGGTIEDVVDLLSIDVDLLGVGLLGIDATGGTATVTLADLTEVVDELLDDIPATDDVELVSADGVTINLTRGTVSLDLELLAGGLDGLDPNTPVLDEELLTRVTTAVTTLLGGITGNLSGALQTAIDDSAITIAIPANVTGLLGATVATTQINVVGTLGGFLDGEGVVSLSDTALVGIPIAGLQTVINAVLGAVTGPVLGAVGGIVDDLLLDSDAGITSAVSDLGTAVGGVVGSLGGVFDVLDQVASITVNAQPTVATPATPSDLGAEGFTVRALDVVLLPALVDSPLASVSLGSASVLNVEPTAVDPTLTLTPEQVRAGGTTTIGGAGWDADGGDVVVTFRDGDTVVGTPVTITPATNGTITGSFTVPAGTGVGELTATAVQGEADASAELTIIASPVVVVTPDPVDPGQSITISGSGFLCGPVTVTVSSGATVLQTIEDVPVTAGTWSTTYLVPADIAVNTLTITATATAAAGCGDTDSEDVEVDLAETLVLTPEKVRIGDVIDIAGGGWATGSSVVVTFTNAAGQVGQPVTLTVSATGTIDGSFTVPTGTAPGSLTGTAVQGTTPPSIDSVVVFVEPTIIVDPDPVDPGDTITISGSGFVCGPVDVTIFDGEDELESFTDVPVTDAGTWSVQYLVPADIDATSLRITAVATGTCDDEEETEVEVDQPETLDLAPATVRVGDSVAIDGTGWAAGTVLVTFENAAGQVGTPVSVTVGADGILDGSFVVPAGTANGALTGTAVQGDDEVEDTVTVIGQPTVVVTPDPVDPGEDITISGSGFACGPVDVTIADGDTVVELIEDVPVAADGTWSTTFEVPADIEATTLTITAEATGTCGDEDTVDVEVDQPETIDLSPGEVRGGDDVTIDGSGWDADGGPVTVVFTDADGVQVGEPVVITPGDDGTIDGTFEVPAGTPAGSLTGTATQGDDTTAETIAVFGAQTVSVDPASVRAGATVDITGGGWLPGGGDVTVTFRDGSGTVVGAPVVISTVATDGTIDGSFTVPAGTAPGDLVATAVQDGDQALDTLTVAVEPFVTVTPDTARPGDVVTVGGGGWTDGTPVSVVFTDEDGVEIGEELTLTPTGGVISGTFAVPAGVDAGTLTATATQGADDDTAELEVTLAPTVSVSPDQLHVGDVLTVGGTGWDPASPVTVTVEDADGVVGTFPLTPNAGGVITGTFTIPAGTELGDLTITAEQGADEATDEAVLVADPTVVVTPDPATPGQQVTISGDGFLCGPVDVTISAGTTVLATITGLAVVDGEWSTVYTVPTTVTASSLTITAVATGVCGDEGGTDLEIDLPETLTASPDFAQRGNVVTLTGSGWEDGNVAISVVDAAGALQGILVVPTTDGSFTRTFTVPALTALGSLQFTATQGSDTERDTITIVSIPTGPSTLIVSPSTVEPGSTIALDGLGWDPTGAAVVVTITTQGGAVLGTVPVSVAPDGHLYTGAFTVPSTVAAPQTLTATAVQGSRTASDTVAIREANQPVIRLGGPTRIEVAVEIARDVYPFGTRVVYVAASETFPDALSAAPAAAQQEAPILLTYQGSLPTIVAEELERLQPDLIVLVGGPNTVSPSVFDTLGDYAPETIRIGGADRYEVSRNIAEYAFPSADTAYVASGSVFADALTAGAAAGMNAAPMLLTYGTSPQPGLVQTMNDLGVDDIYIAGGPISVPQSNVTAFESAGFDVVERFDGANRYEVGVNVAQSQFLEPVERIYVATGVRFPDALAGSAVAGAAGQPVYVSPVECLWEPIPGEVDRLGDPQIVLLGGTASLSDRVFNLETC